MFSKFKQDLKKRVDSVIEVSPHLYVVDVNKDEFWNVYLNAYPEDEQQEHNCNACKSYIRNFGNVVGIRHNTILTMWEFETEDPVFQNVANKLHEYISSKPIKDIFRHKFKHMGADSNKQQLEDGTVKTWQHMFYLLPKKFVVPNVAAVQGVDRDLRNVLKRGLEELTEDSVLTVLELISSRSLYRGEEHEAALNEFLKLKKEWKDVPQEEREAYYWSTYKTTFVSGIRNTSVGTLLIDLSEGVDIEVAVSKFEKMMAPSNYKRPNAIFTERMRQDAEKTIEELGLEDSLQRRFATIDDVKVNDVRFLNRSNKSTKLGVLGALKESTAVSPKTFSKVDTIHIDKFVKDVLPLAESVEILFEKKHIPNLVSLIAPVNLHAPAMFKWKNPFSWSYNNALADSMKEKVKAAGGNVEGKLRISLEWFNFDDLDLHLILPNGSHVYHAAKRDFHTGATLDVDIKLFI